MKNNVAYKAITLLTKPEKLRGLVVLLLAIFMGLFEVIGVASVVPFLTILANPEIINQNSILNFIYKYIGFNNANDFLIFLGFAAFLLIIVASIIRTVGQYALTRFAQMRRHSLASRLLKIYIFKPFVFFLNRNTSDLSKIILSEVDQVINGVFQPGAIMVGQVFTVLAIVIFLFVVDPIVCLIAASLLGSIYLLIYLLIQSYLKKIGKNQIEFNKMRFEATQEAFGAIKEIKLYAKERAYLSRFDYPSIRMASTISTGTVMGQIPKFTIEAFAFGGILALSMFLMNKYGGYSSNALGSVLPLLGLYAFAGYRLIPAMQIIYFSLTQVKFFSPAIDNIYKDLFQDEKEISHFKNNDEEITFNSTLELKKMSYCYLGSERQALTDISLKLESGESLGIVGSTGSGKSTLVNIMLGLLNPSSGSILIDGNELTDTKIRSWQKNIAYVPQDIFLLDTSIKFNIALGQDEEEIDYERLLQSIRISQLEELINNELPNGIDTIVGERGIRLSGGQKQRIGIARALYQKPKIVFFDEATSSLDSVTEKKIINDIENLQGAYTLVMIAHRVTTLKSCNQILVLNNGSIVDQGKYKDLLRRNILFQDILKSSH